MEKEDKGKKRNQGLEFAFFFSIYWYVKKNRSLNHGIFCGSWSGTSRRSVDAVPGVSGVEPHLSPEDAAQATAAEAPPPTVVVVPAARRVQQGGGIPVPPAVDDRHVVVVIQDSAPGTDANAAASGGGGAVVRGVVVVYAAAVLDLADVGALVTGVNLFR